jgi:DcmR-like sensory protein
MSEYGPEEQFNPACRRHLADHRSDYEHGSRNFPFSAEVSSKASDVVALHPVLLPLAPLPPSNVASTIIRALHMDRLSRHQCLIYDGSPVLHLRSIAQVIIAKLRANIRCLYLNSPTMVAETRSCLAAAGLNVAQEVSKGSLVLSWDAGHLVDGRFEVNRLLGMLSDSVDAALTDGYSGLWATGDMTWELGSKKNFERLVEYEIGLEEMFRSLPALSGVCQYHQETLPEESLHVALSTHPAVYINATLARINPLYSPTGPPFVPALDTPTLKERLDRLRLSAHS